MQLTRYNPRKDINRLERELEKTFKNTQEWPWPVLFQDPSVVDMYTEDKNLVVKATLPGFKKEEVTLNAGGDMLEVTAKRTEEEGTEAKRGYLLHESTQSYYRQVALPEGAVADEAKAVFDNGVLTVTMPIEKQAEVKEIAIK